MGYNPYQSLTEFASNLMKSQKFLGKLLWQHEYEAISMAIMTLGETSMQKTYFFSLIFPSSLALKVLPLLRFVFVLSGRQCVSCCLLQQRAKQFLIQCRGLFLNPSFQMHWVVVFMLLCFFKAIFVATVSCLKRVFT